MTTSTDACPISGVRSEDHGILVSEKQDQSNRCYVPSFRGFCRETSSVRVTVSQGQTRSNLPYPYYLSVPASHFQIGSFASADQGRWYFDVCAIASLITAWQLVDVDLFQLVTCDVCPAKSRLRMTPDFIAISEGSFHYDVSSVSLIQ